jgi:iron complex transport system substrate-binding protein
MGEPTSISGDLDKVQGSRRYQIPPDRVCGDDVFGRFQPGVATRCIGFVALKKACVCTALLLVLSLSAPAARLLLDDAGRSVSVPDQVHRVICLTPSITDTVYAIGGGEDIAGITDYTHYPPQAARQKPSVGDLLHPSLEKIASLHPDLAIAVATLNSSETVQGIERIGIPVFLVTDRGLSGLYHSISSIGLAIGRGPEADSLIGQLRVRERRVRSLAAQAGRGPSVFLVLSLDPCITAGRGAFITELISVAGARPITHDLTQDWLRVSLEAMISRKPDYVLVLKDSPFGLNEMQQRPGWNSLDAVRLGHVIRIDDRLQFPSPVAFDALEDFARQIHALPAASPAPTRKHL